jgi:Domain of unknown function (DUF1905)
MRTGVRSALPTATYPAPVDLQFTGEVWPWRGPAPYHFVTVPDRECAALRSVAGRVSYGWGMIPAVVRIDDTEWTTSLWPKDGAYVVPLKDAVRRAEDVEVGDIVTIRLTVDV